ncbi:TRAP transporter, DctM subunit [uncultured delta proteobacterium]|uniref:TRAP transporter, DctM subunit n=1 Tax=uncultured delta proteobacterium TaxID=34034 RepID=A0A212K2Z2_9DELT|nr:TRAP transporter, DctM subunit [uncultured delta proteobacterium]
MSWVTILLALILITMLLLGSGFYICVGISIASIAVLMLLGKLSLLQILSNVLWNTSTDFMMTAIPLFLLMGDILMESNLSGGFYRGLSKFLRFIPGGLLHSNIMGCGIFSAISGSSVACAAAIGGVAIPDQKKLGYFPRYIYGSLASGGTLGILIPPSIAMIIYCALTDSSVVMLFKCATVPGITLMLAYMGFIFFAALVKKDLFPKGAAGSTVADITTGEALKGVAPFFILIAAILGSIYGGIATATEAAAIGCVLSLVISRICGNLTKDSLVRAMKNTLCATSMILFITISAKLFSYVLTATGATREMVSWVSDLNLSYVGLLLVVYSIYIILGCFVESTAMLFLTLPVLYPILKSYDINLIWFGVVLVILVELGQITPPVGINLFVIKGVDPVDATLGEIVKGVIPYAALMLGFVAFLTVFPGYALLFY